MNMLYKSIFKFCLLIFFVLAVNCKSEKQENFVTNGKNEIGDINSQDVDKTTPKASIFEIKINSVKVGMSKQEVLNTIGFPINKIEDDVWLFNSKLKPLKKNGWQEIYGQMKSGRFLIFDNEHLLELPRGINTDSPHYVYANAKRIKIEEVPERYIFRFNGVIQEYR